MPLPLHVHRAALALAVSLAAPLVHAATVTFTGGFTSFTGPVATLQGAQAATIHTEVNGVTQLADHAFPDADYIFVNYGLGLKEPYSLRDAAGEPIPTVAFERAFFSAPKANGITFTPSGPLDLQVGASFNIGTFTLTNGSWFGNSPGENVIPPTDFGFTVTTHSADASLNGHTFSGTLPFVVTAPAEAVATVESDADYFYLVERPDLGTMRVYESTDPWGQPQALGNTGSIDLRVRIGSLIPEALVNATGAAFVGAPAPVPEPGSLALWLGGLAGLGALARARRG